MEGRKYKDYYDSLKKEESSFPGTWLTATPGKIQGSVCNQEAGMVPMATEVSVAQYHVLSVSHCRWRSSET